MSADLSNAVAAAYANHWDEALDALLRAAEAGDSSAQEQLALLANTTGRSDWSAMRSGIDTEKLLTPSPLERLSDRALVGASRGFATPAMCAWLIADAEPRLTPSLVNDSATGELRQHPMRTALTCAFGPPDRDMIVALMQARAARLVKTPVNYHEPPNVISYTPGQHFSLHVDFIDPNVPQFHAELQALGQRTVTIVTYLNDDFEGAPTHFPALGVDFRGGVGDAVVFSNVRPDGSPDPNTVHAGLPPASGRKWVLSQWLRNRPQPYDPV